MSAKQHLVELTAAQRRELETLVRTGAHKAFARRRAQIWLQADQGAHGPGRTDAVIAEGLDLSVRTVERARRDWAARGLAGLQTAPMDHPRNPRILDGAGEARLVALACGKPPPGFAKWTGQLLAEALMAEGVVETISATTVNVVLKKRAEALEAAVLVHARSAQRTLRAEPGGRARPL